MLVKLMVADVAGDNSVCAIFAGVGKVEAPADIEPSLSTCTHLIYGFAIIDSSNYKLVPLDEYLELDSGKGYYRAVTSLKKRYPGLSILLSVGGLADPDKEKYLTLVCDTMSGTTFLYCKSKFHIEVQIQWYNGYCLAIL
jgi:hypothetical protein